MAALKHIHGGNLREAADKYGLGVHSLIDFSANINPLGPSLKAIEAITGNLDAITRYPDPDAVRLKAEVARWTSLPEDMIVVGNGAVELIYLLMKQLKPLRALIPAPTFNEYEIAVRTNGGLVKDLPLNEGEGFAVTRESVCGNWDDTNLIFVCNPNNPTGTLTRREVLIDIIREAQKLGKTVVVDEAFMDFVPQRSAYTVVDLVPQYDNLFVLYSLTKFFAIPGLRLGLGLGPRGIISELNQLRDPWNVNCFAQLAGVASLQDESYIQATVEYVARQKQYLYEKIRNIKGLRPYPPSVNYIFIDVRETGLNSAEVTALLGQQGILVRDCSSYKNLPPVFIRVAVRTQEDNDRLVDALSQLGRG